MSSSGRATHAGSVISIMFVVGLSACGSPATNGGNSQSTSNDLPVKRGVVCQFHDRRLVEISGLAASTQHPGILWTHNDSGDTARVFAVDAATCDVRAEIKLAGIAARDIEAIAVGKASNGTPVVWVGDIGDNVGSAPSVHLYRFNEPTVIRSRTVPTMSFEVRYPDGPHNAEGLLVAPTAGGAMWIVTKSRIGSSGIYRLPLNFTANGSGTAHLVGQTLTEATDASYAPDGKKYAVRGYFQASQYPAPPPSGSGRSINLPLQPQGEAMTYSANSQFMLMAGEQSNDLWTVPLP